MATRTSSKATTPTVDVPAETTAPAESEASKASRTAPLDLAFLAGLKPVAVAAPVRKAGAGRKAEDNSVVEAWLSDSWDSRKDGETVGEGRAVSVPAAAVGTIKSRLNKAAATLNLGVAIEVIVSDNKETATVNYAAKTRKVRKPKNAASTVEASAETPAE